MVRGSTAVDDVARAGGRVAASSDDVARAAKAAAGSADDAARGAKVAAGSADDVARGGGKVVSRSAKDVATDKNFLTMAKRNPAGAVDDAARLTGASKTTVLKTMQNAQKTMFVALGLAVPVGLAYYMLKHKTGPGSAFLMMMCDADPMICTVAKVSLVVVGIAGVYRAYKFVVGPGHNGDRMGGRYWPPPPYMPYGQPPPPPYAPYGQPPPYAYAYPQAPPPLASSASPSYAQTAPPMQGYGPIRPSAPASASAAYSPY